MEKNHINKLWIFLLAFTFIIPLTSAAYVTVPNKVVNQSQVFNINISIDPLGKPISGAQLDIAFNRSMFNVNSISEGNLLNQSSATFFSKGVINNATGNVMNIFNVMLGNKNVSSKGVFIIVNMTATGMGGSSWINLSNVKISDPDALPVPVESANGSIEINSPPVRPASATKVTPTNKVVNKGQIFDINISIDSLGKPISGAQLDIAFNRSMFKVNSISEGNLLNQNGATTFISKGIINNTTGNVKNIFNVILGNKSVSSSGVFIIINMTAIGSGGSSWINLSNVKISDPDALPVTVKSANGSIIINNFPAQ